MMEAARTPGTSVDIQLRTRQYVPEDSQLPNQLLSIGHVSNLDVACVMVFPTNGRHLELLPK
jgi:hypothetical protein